VGEHRSLQEKNILFFEFKKGPRGTIHITRYIYVREQEVKWMISKHCLTCHYQYLTSVIPTETIKEEIKADIRPVLKYSII